jgi:arginase family enzyme
MKLIGRYNCNEAFRLELVLDREEIPCKLEEVKGILRAGVAGEGKLSDMDLFVEDKDYEKAVQFIKEKRIEEYKKSEELVKIDGKEADRVMLMIFIGGGCLVVLGIYFWGKNTGLW